MDKDVRLMKGNEAIAEAAIRCGCDGYFGYPITPQTEIMETLMALRPWDTTGMVVLQSESEVASVNMLYGGAAAGKKVMTSSSSPGVSLMCEGLSYLATAELPCVIVNIARGGPGLGTIQPSQSDYFQMTKGGGHGDYRMVVLAPNSVQEMNDFVELAFDLAFKYLTPVVILSDGIIGQMMEKVVLKPQQPRWSQEYINQTHGSWATTGKKSRTRNIVSSVNLEPVVHEAHNHKLQAKYRQMHQEEVRYEVSQCDDADYVLVAYGSSARICDKVVELARQEGIKVGLLRPITLFPFPMKQIEELSHRVKGFLSVEMSCGQMEEDVRLASQGRARSEHYGRMGGAIHSPDDVFNYLLDYIKRGE